MKKINIPLSTYVLLLMVSFSLAFYTVKQYSPDKQKRISEIEHYLDMLDGLVVTHWKYYSSFDIEEQQKNLRAARNEPGIALETAVLLLILSLSIFTSASVVLIPELIETYKSSKRVTENIKPKLNELEEEMKKIDAMDNKVEAIVRLFQVISPIQDAGGFSQEMFKLNKHNRRGRLNNQVKALEALQTHFHNAGRSEYGINRTMKGEEVTAEKVYLGNIHGLWTKTAAYWLSKKSDSAWHLINDCQCGDFVESHVEGILKQIAVLKAAV